MSSCITGWAHSKFGVNSEQTSENMIADAVEKLKPISSLICT